MEGLLILTRSKCNLPHLAQKQVRCLIRIDRGSNNCNSYAAMSFSHFLRLEIQ